MSTVNEEAVSTERSLNFLEEDSEKRALLTAR